MPVCAIGKATAIYPEATMSGTTTLIVVLAMNIAGTFMMRTAGLDAGSRVLRRLSQSARQEEPRIDDETPLIVGCLIALFLVGAAIRRLLLMLFVGTLVLTVTAFVWLVVGTPPAWLGLVLTVIAAWGASTTLLSLMWSVDIFPFTIERVENSLGNALLFSVFLLGCWTLPVDSLLSRLVPPLRRVAAGFTPRRSRMIVWWLGFCLYVVSCVLGAALALGGRHS